MNTFVGPIKKVAIGIYDGPHATPPESDSGPVFLGIKNVTPEGRLDLSEIRHVSEEFFPKWTRRVTPRENDIVFSYEATLHRYALIPEGFRGCLGRRMALVRPDTQKVYPKFLHYYFLSSAWRTVVESSVINGATVDRVPLTRFPDFEVRIPVMETQKRIAEILSYYDDLIENNQRRIQLLEQAARLLYKEWFVHLRFPGHEHVKIKDGVPEGWEKTTVLKVCSSFEDGDWIESKDQGGDDFRLLQISNIGDNEFRETGNFRYVTSETFLRLRCNEVCPGDILISRMPKPIGRAWYVYEQPWRMITAVDVTIARPNPSIIDPYLFLYHLNSEKHIANCELRATGATRPRITRKNMGALPILVPPKLLQRRFGEVAKSINEQRFLLIKQNEKLAQARDLLLPRLMNGEVSV